MKNESKFITMNHLKVVVTNFYPEDIRTKKDAAQYQIKGTCEVSLWINGFEFDIRNITYRIEHSGKIHLKPPFRVHSNKKAGIKPKLVPSIVFRNPQIWIKIEECIREELLRLTPQHKKMDMFMQLDLFEKFSA